MKINIRPETPKDYLFISNITYEAFLNWKPENPFVKEPMMIDVIRHTSLFDPELSLIAELEGQVVGHVILSPFQFYMSGTPLKGVVLGPISISPEFQNQGLGGQLIEAAHEVAIKKSYDLSLLCGHPEYYPKFGYKTSMFALSSSKVIVHDTNFDMNQLKERPVKSSDLKWLTDAWQEMHQHDQLAILPGHYISDWMNHSDQCYSSAIIENDEMIGYVRYSISDEVTIKEILGENHVISNILTYLKYKYNAISHSGINVNILHDHLNKILEPEDIFTTQNVWATYDAFMIKPLSESKLVHDYCQMVESNIMQCGSISLPPVYDIEE